MTTISYKAGFMAADSRCTWGHGAFATKCQKIYRLENKALLGSAGDADCRDLIAVLGKCSPKRLPSRLELAATKTDFFGILVFPNETIYYICVYPNDVGNTAEWTAQVLECKEKWAAAGSGSDYALGALSAGKSAKQAVEIACRYDSFSSAPVVEIGLKPLIPAKAPARAKKK
jgi:ATP-dependent protease HslVU (ClpYQ) peptidase subunit